MNASLDAYCKDGECYIPSGIFKGIHNGWYYIYLFICFRFSMGYGGGVIVLVEREFNEL